MNQSKKRPSTHIGYSIIIVGIWSSIVLLISANTFSAEIEPFYIWTKISTLVAGYGAVTCLILRIFNKIDHSRNFVYTLFATSNLLFGLAGLVFYLLHKINVVGFHDLLVNMLLGIVVFADICFFDYVFSTTHVK